MRSLLILIFLMLTEGLTAQQPLRLGINFPLRNPETAAIPVYMDLLMESGAQMARQLTYADVFWRQLEPTSNNWDFTWADSVFLDYPDIAYTGTVYSMFMEDSVGYQVPWRACSDPGNPGCRWIPGRDSTDTKEYLDSITTHFGSEIKYWELGNEVENHNYPEGFPMPMLVQFFGYNHRWIKSLAPDSKIILPSFIGTYGVPLGPKYEWLRDIFSLGGGEFVDIIGYHDYNSWWTMPLHIDSILAVMDSYGYGEKPLWVTECSVSSTLTPITPGYASVDEQAADVWRRPCLAWSKGVELYFWQSLYSSGPPSQWQEFGIVNHNGIKKKSFHSFQFLAETLTDFTSSALVSHGVINDDNETGGEGVWVIDFEVDGELLQVMWSPDNQTRTLEPLNTTAYYIRDVVPYYISPDGEEALFETDTIVVSGGESYTLPLTSLPVLVTSEEITQVEVVSGQNAIAVFPNPADESLKILRSKPGTGMLTFKILNAAGMVVYTSYSSSSCLSIPVNGLPNGMYSIRMEEEGTVITQKFIIQHTQ